MRTQLHTDDIIKLKNILKKNKDYREQLAGHIREEYKLDSVIYDKITKPYLNVYKKGWEKFYNKKFTNQLICDSVWVNYMKAGEFNPRHQHSQDFSSVLYLEIPKSLKKEASSFVGTSEVPGSIMFDITSYDIPNFIGHYHFLPEVGDMVIFPSNTGHTVFPFQSRGVRISVAANYSLKTDKK